MKKSLIWVLAVTTIALGAVCVVQWQKHAAQKTQMVSLRGELEQKTQETDELQASQKHLDKQRSELLGQADELATRLQARQLADAKAPALAPTRVPLSAEGQKADTDGGGLGKIMSKMMDNPETRKFIRDQQRQMMDPLYGPLVKQMGLTPEEAEKFKDLLADNLMKGAGKASSLFSGLSSTNRTEVLNTLAAERKSFDEQLKASLGDTRYAQYQDYQQTVGERAQLNQFRQQTAGGGNALTDPQTEQLLVFMKEEKQAVAAATGPPLPGTEPGQADLQAMFSEDQAERFLQTQGIVNGRVYERAQAMLAPDQLQMMRMGMSMARKFLAPDKPAGGSAPPPP
jgi:hypothetical protein